MEVWIYEAIAIEDGVLQSQLKVFANEQLAREFWEKRKPEILSNVDDDLVIEDDGDSLCIYEDGNACEWSWYDSIRPYQVQQTL